jgi:hypothetical protein
MVRTEDPGIGHWVIFYKRRRVVPNVIDPGHLIRLRVRESVFRRRSAYGFVPLERGYVDARKATRSSERRVK